MGYTPEEKHYRLHFEDEKYTGLEVTVRSFNVKRFMNIIGMVKFMKIDLNDLSKVNPEDLAEVEQIFFMLGDVLVSWNLEIPKGVPVPATLEGVQSLDLDLCFDILFAAFEAVMAVSSPLKPPSTGGSTSEVPPIPMETL